MRMYNKNKDSSVCKVEKIYTVLVFEISLYLNNNSPGRHTRVTSALLPEFFRYDTFLKSVTLWENTYADKVGFFK